MGDIADGPLRGFEIGACAGAEIRFPLEQRFRVERHRGERIVDVVSDAARHLPEHAQSLLLHDGLLCPPQIVISLFERGIDVRLARRHRYVLTQLPEKLAVAAAETIDLAARHDDNAENIAFRAQRSGNHRAQASLAKTRGKRKIHQTEVGLIDQMAAHAARQAILIDDEARLFAHGELSRQYLAVQPDAADRKGLGLLAVETDTAEIDRQVIFKRTHDDLENASQILPLADGARDLIEQTEAPQLLLERFLQFGSAHDFRL